MYHATLANDSSRGFNSKIAVCSEQYLYSFIIFKEVIARVLRLFVYMHEQMHFPERLVSPGCICPYMDK